MVSIIKNQLLKHLSRYTKNLSSDKINLSTFRGEGELSNLQLDENVLTELLELPSWLRLTSAWCNHVAFRIHWTKLKSVPITLSLDEVNISVETCEFGRSGGGAPTPGLQALTAPQGKYSFIHKVIDGITIIVNTVNVSFKSPAFTASVQMSRIRVESKTPKWLLGDLRVTRLKDPTRGLLLIFKELSWQTVRIEASSTQDESLTPLRLLTNQASCRITIKKRLSDCNVLNCRLVLILDDLLWVLTDSQLKAALHFVDSLSGLIKTSTNANQKTKAQKKLEMLPEYQAQIAQQSRQPDAAGSQTTAQKSFNLFDVRETSYHFFSQRIDLHLCDDPGDGRSCHPDLRDGGALQISVQGFQVDYYPYHLAKASRIHWPKYKEASTPTALWLEQSLNQFRESLLDLYQPNRPPSHAPLERTPNIQGNGTAPGSRDSPSMQDSPVKKQVLDNLSKLMSACVILRIEDFTLYRVTTSGKKQMPKEFISGDKDRYSFPTELSAVHAEFTYFYYPGDFVFPLPPSKIFVHINPVQIHFDVDSLLWLSSFGLNLHNSLMRTSVVDSMNAASPPGGANEPSLMYMDVKMEAILPRVVFESNIDVPSQRDRPKIMQIQISRTSVTNIREMGTSRADLAQALHSLQEGSLVFSSGFPSKEGDLCIVTDRILSHVAASDVTPSVPSQAGSPQSNASGSILSRHALWTEPRDVWCVKLDPIWIEFYGARSVGVNKAIPFLDAVPVTLWLHGKSDADAKFLPFETDSTRNARKGQKEASRQSFSDFRQSSTDGGMYLMPNIQEDFYSTQQHSNMASNPFHNQQSFDSTYSSTLKSQNADSSSDEKSADLHVIAHVSNLVSLQIDHYQFLFILRLAEDLTELSTFLSLDTKRIMAEKATTNSIIVGCVIPQVEVTLVMPSQTPGKESSGGDGESVVPDSASLGTNTAWPSLDHTKSMNPFGSVESPSPTGDPSQGLEGFHQSNPNTHGYNVQIQSQPTSSQPVPPSPSAKTELLSSLKGGRNRNSVSDTSFTREINTGIMSIKKGFSTMMTSIDSALKVGTDDASDTFSIHSDLSSDSENYIMVEGTADCMDVMFRLNPFATDSNLKASPVEMASEVCEEQIGAYKTNISSPSEPSEASIWRRRDLVSMATFRLTTVEIIRQNQGSDSSLRLQVAAVSCDECGAIPWDELQTGHQTPKTKFGARCRAWNMAPYNPESPPCIQVRLEEELNAPEDLESGIKDKKSVLSWFSHKVDVLVKDLTMQMSMSTVIGLNDLCEDEVIPRPLPMDITVENVRLNLIEDRPPVNITSPGPIPINLAIGRMKIERDKSGIFYIQPESHGIQRDQNAPQGSRKERDREVISLQLVLQQLKMDNESLKKQLTSAEKASESHQIRAKQENEVLKTYLKAAQDDITTLLDEKRTLLDTVRSLQQQLTQAETNKNVGNR
ncbi:bridge-like lipid transfer protein family member 3B isoform X2 [Lutzomyia longipalpis]|uniref:bridge-like lipid transfer protein family member 3B isoform X2 n=1 Tax=Lutzomyia longipalpis TaxID=7200 RepID=UPI00248455CB|nr:bridge-like lipid transfer protein family member 3B isoform X2 [Lutzomyia longipalpis]